MKKLGVSLGVLLALCMAVPASAATTVQWVPKAHYPCKYGAGWALRPPQGITSATLTVDGTSYPMTEGTHWSYTVKAPVPMWYAESVGAVYGTTVATATYEGSAEGVWLDIAGCIETPPSPTPPPTTPPPTTPPPTTPPTTTPPPHTRTTPPAPCDDCHRHTADTGGSVTPALAGLGFLLLGSAALRIASRKRTR